MVTKIRRGARLHLYITEWREDRGLSLEALGTRIDLEKKQGVEKNTVWRWENDQKRLDPFKIAAIAYALGIEPEDLWRPPGRRSLDAMIASESDEIKDTATDIVTRLVRRAS